MPRKRASARSIVPSPPSTTARSTLGRVRPRSCELDAGLACHVARRASAGPIACGLPCVTHGRALRRPQPRLLASIRLSMSSGELGSSL